MAGSLRRSPYVWLSATILALLLMNSGLAHIAAAPGHGSTAWALVGAAGVAWGTAGWLLWQTRRVRRDMPAGSFVVVRWVMALTPFLFAYAAVAAGGEQWVFALGFVVSAILLFVSACRTRRETLDSPLE